jgi:hypothetical protein
MNWFNEHPKLSLGIVFAVMVMAFMFELNKEKAVIQPVDTHASAACAVYDGLKAKVVEVNFDSDDWSDQKLRERAKDIWDFAQLSNDSQLKEASKNFLLSDYATRHQHYYALGIICSKY